MLNNVKDFLISKKEAFKMGEGLSKMANTAMHCLKGAAFGASIALVISETAAVIIAIKDGKELIHIKEAFPRNKD